MNLNAGPVQVFYENGFLRYLTIGGKEILRMIYFAVRDCDWNTSPINTANEQIEYSDNHFKISYKVFTDFNGIKIDWLVSISGERNGTITFSIDGTAQIDFLKNRTGLCILHPIENVSGSRCIIRHTDDSERIGRFPVMVSPHQPFKNIRSMQWHSADQAWFQLDFTGDIFETEDQRNWTDASFKTYCTPLDLPFPALVKKSDKISQTVIFRPLKAVVNTKSLIDQPPILIAKPMVRRFPIIGFGMNPSNQTLQTAEVSFLKSIGLNYLRADVYFTENNFAETFKNDIEQANLLGLPLELALFFGDNPPDEAYQLIHLLGTDVGIIRSISLYESSSRQTTNELLNQLVPVLRANFPGVNIGGGADANFAEFNRSRLSPELMDYVTFAMNPQVHASDDLTLLENMEGQGFAVKTALKIPGNKEVRVSPVTLKQRFNAVASKEPEERGRIPASDVRQTSFFTAAWALGSVKYLAEAGAAAITFFETTGERGVCWGNSIFPVGYFFRMLMDFKPDIVIPVSCGLPLKVSALLLQKNDKKRLIVANHTSHEQSIYVPEEIQFSVLSTLDAGGGTNTYNIAPTLKKLNVPVEKFLILDEG